MKRLAARITFFGALGFFLTVAMCWWLALGTDRMTSPRFKPMGGLGMTGYISATDSTMWLLHPERGAFDMRITSGKVEPEAANGVDPSIAAQWYVTMQAIPAWSVIRRGDSRGTKDVFYNEQAFGWPMLALAQCERSAVVAETGKVRRDTDGLRMPAAMRKHFRGDAVPLRVLWLGAIVDSALVGWMCYAVYCFPSVLIRAGRRRRHRCIACGYDLRGAAHWRCPECGRSIQTRSSA